MAGRSKRWRGMEKIRDRKNKHRGNWEVERHRFDRYHRFANRKGTGKRKNENGQGAL